jgi:DNA-3-methyladenine glycosylase I
MTSGVIASNDAKLRCWWCGEDATYVSYHDSEWGVPVHEDRWLFEKLVLEGFQSGLSWITILRKRQAFREVFFDFAPEAVAALRDRDVSRLLLDARIIRHRGKIEAAISNARAYAELVAREGSFARFVWSFAPSRPAVRRRRSDVPSSSADSVAFSKELRRRGWRFVGPTTAYAFFQAMGLVNDHLHDCFRYAEVAALPRESRG